MLRSLGDMRGYTIRTTDDTLGKVKDFLFDERDWVVRYMVADTTRWLPGRTVLIPWQAFEGADGMQREFAVRLSRQQVEDSPALAEGETISREHETMLHRHYDYAPYWTLFGTAGAMPFSPVPSDFRDRRFADEEVSPASPRGSVLQSVTQVTGYHIGATDGTIGHVVDLVGEDEEWIVRYIAVDTRNWLPGRKVLIAPEWLRDIDWMSRRLDVDVDRQTIKNSPVYDPTAAVNRDYEEQLYDYYGRIAYWARVDDLPRPTGNLI